MSGSIARYGAMNAINHLAGNAVPAVQGTAPTWVPGLYWIDSSSGYSVKSWNGTTWSTSPAPGTRYLALLYADPVQAGAVNVSDLAEITTTGYARQQVAFNNGTAAIPSVVGNTALITFGPMTVTMTQTAGWAALVTSASGTGGFFLFSWVLDTPQLVQASQSIQISPSNLAISDQ